jgi:hypothetical protein
LAVLFWSHRLKSKSSRSQKSRRDGTGLAESYESTIESTGALFVFVFASFLTLRIAVLVLDFGSHFIQVAWVVQFETVFCIFQRIF